jgi:hypothetical protein
VSKASKQAIQVSKVFIAGNVASLDTVFMKMANSAGESTCFQDYDRCVVHADGDFVRNLDCAATLVACLKKVIVGSVTAGSLTSAKADVLRDDLTVAFAASASIARPRKATK